MPTAASSEFIALCRAQLQLLAEGLGASRSIVYLTEGIEGGTSKLLPAIVYPDTEIARAVAPQIAPSQEETISPPQSEPMLTTEGNIAILAPSRLSETSDRTLQSSDDRNSRLQVVLPLVYDGTIVGLLMTTRESQPWNTAERTEIQHVAQTLALAGIMDLRRNWLANELSHQQQLQIQQRDLLHNLLHQLRNPLTAIRTFGKLLIKRLNPDERDRSIANSIVRESNRLQELLQHLEVAIDLNAVTAATDTVDNIKQLPAPPPPEGTRSANLLLPDATFRIESCQIADVLSPLISSAEAIAQDRELSFHAHIPPELPLVQAHPVALQEVLSNLIDNALKYTPAGGEVDVDVELIETPKKSRRKHPPATLQISVRDTGLGIPPQDLEKLFTRHYRGVQAQGNIAGTGLGLAIAKELVTHMNGKLAATSPPPGSDRGTEFILSLPLVS
jgi:signal transduction histidine kinase